MRLLLTIVLLVTYCFSFGQSADTAKLRIQQHRFGRLMKKKNTVLLDVRTPEEYKSGYIGRAVNLDVMDSLQFVNTVSSLNKNKRYLLYCKSSRRSAKALVMMKHMGFKKLYHLDGGVIAWKDELNKPQ